MIAGVELPYLNILSSVRQDLVGLNGPAEEAFLRIGAALGEASSVLGGIRAGFGTLIEQLDGNQVLGNAEVLSKATDRITTLASGSHGSADVLRRLNKEIHGIDARLFALGKVVGEISGLAINAKIQAALIAEGDVEFTAFTSEIRRLGVLAEKTIEQTRAQLSLLGNSITTALMEEQSFERNSAQELTSVKERLVGSSATMQHQHRAASAAVERMGVHSSDTAQRVVACMTELQFNDTACQRIEHVRDAIGIIVELAKTDTEENLTVLVGAVCRLQAMQLNRTAGEYQQRVSVLAEHLREIGKDATSICDEADVATSSDTSGHQGSFVETLEKDIAVGAKLLIREATGQGRIKAIVHAVTDGFVAMAKGLDAILSFDTDVRVMGLNATFKCARLGAAGRALGVIAQELRACSKRTEELSGQVSSLLGHAIDLSQSLGVGEGEDAAEVNGLATWMENFSIDLNALHVRLDSTLKKLRSDGGQVATLLTATADAIVVHHRMHEALSKAAKALENVAAMTGVEGSDIAAMGDRIRSLLAGHYTMQSERLIHQIFANCFDQDQAAPVTNQPSGSRDINDLLF